MQDKFSHPNIYSYFYKRQDIEATGFSQRDIETKCLKIPKALLQSNRPFSLQNQTHSCDCHYISKQSSLEDQSDAQRTDQINLPLGVTFADCIPLLFYATEPKLIIGTIHAGWKGVSGNIMGNTIQQLKENNIDTSSLHLRIGPSICKDCFEFGADGSDPYQYFSLDCITKNEHNLRNIDTRAMLTQQALEAGVLSNHITQDNRCTVETLELCSRRREKIVGKNNYAWVEISQNEL